MLFSSNSAALSNYNMLNGMETNSVIFKSKLNGFVFAINTVNGCKFETSLLSGWKINEKRTKLLFLGMKKADGSFTTNSFDIESIKTATIEEKATLRSAVKNVRYEGHTLSDDLEVILNIQ